MDANDQWMILVDEMLVAGRATHGSRGTGGRRGAFGSTALKVDGRIFAMLMTDRLVVKLPAARADALVAAGKGERLDADRGRPKREWLVVASDDPTEWRALAHEAQRYVEGSGARV